MNTNPLPIKEALNRLRRRQGPKQLEVKFNMPEGFKLAIQQTMDGERLASHQARVINLRTQSEQLQQKIFA